MTQTRKRIKHATSLEERLALVARERREQAERLPPGTERETLMRKARQAETAANITEWISSPGLRPPT
jgi:hypothetical protein